MPQCQKCERPLSKEVGTYRYEECGVKNVWLEDWDMLACEKCGDRMPILSDASTLEHAIAWRILSSCDRLDGESINFLRRTMGLRSTDLASSLGVSRVEVSRWENGHATINPHNEFKLRMSAMEGILPTSVQPDLMSKFNQILLNRRFGGEGSAARISLVPGMVEELRQGVRG